MRTIDGLKVGFIEHDVYFGSLSRETSMVGVSRDQGADIVLLLAPGKTEADLSDEEVRALIDALKGNLEQEPRDGQ